MIYRKLSIACPINCFFKSYQISTWSLTYLLGSPCSYLFNRSQMIGIAGTTSSPCHVLSGVLQGSVLGPPLFLVYIDGLSDLQLNGGSLTMFADDLLLHKAIYLTAHSRCNTLAEWLTDFKLMLIYTMSQTPSSRVGSGHETTCSCRGKVSALGGGD